MLMGLVALAGHALKHRWLQNIGWLIIVAQALSWTGFAGRSWASIGLSPLNLLMPWHMARWSAWVMRPLPKPARKSSSVPS
ncbi:hypothetical protein ACQKGO_35600 [Corallococcus interemptor]|uniref:hypothetical protein n=1 Tax=Corallococcus interemptor TaxID=2316720 RepID=UPI003CFFB0E4